MRYRRRYRTALTLRSFRVYQAQEAGGPAAALLTLDEKGRNRHAKKGESQTLRVTKRNLTGAILNANWHLHGDPPLGGVPYGALYITSRFSRA